MPNHPSMLIVKLQLSGFVCLFLSLFAVGASAQTVVRGPYLQTSTQTAITIKWRTDIATDARVEFGDAPDNLSMSSVDSVVTTEHEIQLTGLQPNTLYYYSIGSSAQILAGDASYSFRTLPVAGTDEPAHIWVLGDPGA